MILVRDLARLEAPRMIRWCTLTTQNPALIIFFSN